MAYDSLKALIRQYIKTNGEQEITGQILQNVLVEMVNQYPSTDGYATQSWVTSQLAGYATTSQLANYLPLTGGTMTGNLNIADIKNINILISHDTLFDSVLRLGNDGNGTVLKLYVGGAGSEINNNPSAITDLYVKDKPAADATISQTFRLITS